MPSYVLLLCSFMSLFLIQSKATDTINTTQLLKDGKSLISSDGSFELRFFSPGNSGRRYVGIWFNNIPAKTVAWVANRESPLFDSKSVLKLTNNSILMLVNSTGGIVWNSTTSRSVQNPIVQLLDSGNLVVRDKDDRNPENYLWQSFDYPGHIELPGMKLGKNLVTGLDQYLTSWKSSDDPSLGAYTYRIDPHGYPQFFLYYGNQRQFRSGPWNGYGFTGSPKVKQNSVYTYTFVVNDREMYFDFDLVNNSILSVKILYEDGDMNRVVWDDHKQGWVVYLNPDADTCDTYAFCGPFASCSILPSVQCVCLNGFAPKVPKNWEAGQWSDGCVRKDLLNCSNGNGFIKYPNVKLPDTRYSWYNTSLNPDECNNICLQNCSCVAYATLNVKEQTGCLFWYDVLIDIRTYPANGQDLYVRVIGKHKRKLWIAVSFTMVGVVLLIMITFLYVWNKRVKREGKTSPSEEFNNNVDKKEELELPVVALNVIVHATNNFSDSNKLGEGGFGPVYKGILEDGQEIAVKRLSQDSRQGQKEFKNEVECIAKLQHRNLVKLVGYCSEAEEQLLIYEFMPNKSLDAFIFDEMRSKLLHWPMRFQIIYGIARGLDYLHQDSRMRIIHRDLKASNILLDQDMKPKISDFGIARMFHGDDCAAKTKRVVGTYGYMSPEYAIDGLFSVKSDVFSFGVLVLEIVSGQSNRGFDHPDHHYNLLGHAWRLFKEGQALDLVDQSTGHRENASEILRSIHVGLLCVQENAEDRPCMSQVTVMLSGDSKLPWPKQPGFYVRRHAIGGVSGSNDQGVSSGSADKDPITILCGR